MHNPLGFHDRAMPAAKASMAAHEQGKFWEYHDLLFSSRQLDDASLEGYAKQLGLDVERWKKWKDSKEVEEKILHDQASMVAHGARGTPGFFINGKPFKGAQPFESFKGMIEASLAEADAEAAKGTKLEDLHRVLAARTAGATFADAVIDGKPAPSAPQAPQQAERRPEVPQGPVDVPVSPDDAWKGAKNATVTIVEFSEFQ
jgi:protein-disulfide isomerase